MMRILKLFQKVYLLNFAIETRSLNTDKGSVACRAKKFSRPQSLTASKIDLICDND